MKIVKTVLCAATLLALPSMAAAYECGFGKHQQAMSCAPGTTWDADAGTCVATPTG